ncbi:MAG: hypothetical protein E7043_08750 [Lentisphaerae bacterium]|nr:hypothetical protein [Lentisphaerota bacterium]
MSNPVFVEQKLKVKRKSSSGENLFSQAEACFLQGLRNENWYPERDLTRRSREPEQSDGNPHKSEQSRFCRTKIKGKKKKLQRGKFIFIS